MKTVVHFFLLCYLAEVTGKIHVEVRLVDIFCRHFRSMFQSADNLIVQILTKKKKSISPLESCEMLLLEPNTGLKYQTTKITKETSAHLTLN